VDTGPLCTSESVLRSAQRSYFFLSLNLQWTDDAECSADLKARTIAERPFPGSSLLVAVSFWACNLSLRRLFLFASTQVAISSACQGTNGTAVRRLLLTAPFFLLYVRNPPPPRPLPYCCLPIHPPVYLHPVYLRPLYYVYHHPVYRRCCCCCCCCCCLLPAAAAGVLPACSQALVRVCFAACCLL
jgi:hypothetical protein